MDTTVHFALLQKLMTSAYIRSSPGSSSKWAPTSRRRTASTSRVTSTASPCASKSRRGTELRRRSPKSVVLTNCHLLKRK